MQKKYLDSNYQCATSHLIAFFDLNDRVISFKEGDGVEKLKEYVLDKKLECGIRVKVRNDRYFIFDFKNAFLGQPFVLKNQLDFLDDSKREQIIEKANIIQNYRIEFLHAFLCCLISEDRRISRFSPSFDKYGMNNYIILSSRNTEIEEVVKSADLNYFSSYSYFLSIKNMIENKKLPESDSDALQAIISALDLIDEIASKKDMEWFYTLGLLYRANNYCRHGLYFDAAVFARSVFEWLAAKEFPNVTTDKGKRYDKLIKRYKVDAKSLDALREFRHDALHALNFPTSNDKYHTHALGIGIAEVVTLYKECSGVDFELTTVTNNSVLLEPIS